VRSFEFFDGVPRRITYDNTRVCVSKIIGPRERELTEGFQQLMSHDLFDPHFCLVRRANEKGVVEGVVKFARLKQSRRRLKRRAKREVENPGESSETHEE